MLIGITGSIATGKSSVAKYLKEKGYLLLDCDKMVHELYENDEKLIKQINDLFEGVVFYSKEENKMKIERSKLKEIVFSNELSKKKLEALVHPIIKQKIKEFKEKNINEIVFAEIPLLIEANMQNDVDQIWVVTVDYNTQIKRLMQRNNLSENETKKVIEQQLSIEIKKKYADVIIDNNNDWHITVKQIEEILLKYKV